jgi:hypothetical protein
MKRVREINFTGTRDDVLHKASEWKAANRRVRIVGDCSPAVVTDNVGGAQSASPDTRVWCGTILYEEPGSN